MAKDVFVKEILTDEMVQAGIELVKKLDASDAQLRSAFWFFYPDERVWKLVLASPLVETEGPRKFYERVLVVTKKSQPDELVVSLNNIGVTSLNDPLVKLMRLAVYTGNGVSGIRFSRNAINSVFVEDAYIYRAE
jgi:hypothetical protein